MIKATSLHSRADLAKYLNKNTPQLACDYFIDIECDTWAQKDVSVLITSFNVPDNEVKFAPEGVLGHLVPSLSLSQMTITFLVPNTGKSIIQELFELQYHNGVPLFLPVSKLPKISINRIVIPRESYLEQALTSMAEYSAFIQVLAKVKTSAEKIMTLKGCRFTRPIPQVSLNSDTAVTYTTTVTFEDFTIE